MMHRMTLISVALIIASVGMACGGETEFDKLVSRIHMPKDDNTQGAGTLVSEMAEVTGKAAQAANPAARRNSELLVCDLEDQLAKCTSADAYKVFTGAIQRVSPEAQAEICFALRRGAANPEFDAAVAKALTPSADYRFKVAAMDVLADHA